MTSCELAVSSGTGNVYIDDNGKDGKFFNVTLETPGFLRITMYHSITATFNVTIFCELKDSKFVLQTRSQNAHIAVVAERKSHLFSCENVSDVDPYIYKQLTLKLDGVVLGRTNITFQLMAVYGDDEYLSLVELPDAGNDTKAADKILYFYPVTVFKTMGPLDKIFRAVIYLFLICSTIGFGVKLDLQVVKECLKKPLAPIIGFVCQYGFMPSIAYGISKLVVADDPAVALGIFVAGCCPGGGVSNIYAFLLKGDISLSITMTAISTIAALGMLPLWVYTLGVTFVREGTQLNIPFVQIVTALAVIIIPLFVGLLIKFKFERLAKILVKIIKPVSIIAIIILITIGMYTNRYIFSLFSPKIVFAGCLLPYIGYLLGGLASLIARQPWTRVKTIAIETGLQNTGIAIVLLMYSFPSPDGELAAVAAIASALMTPLPLFLVTVPYLIYNKCKERRYAKVPTKNGDLKNGKVKDEMVGDKLTAV
ncbi:hypothetical protein ScPMuIL_001511 [Solemya velum]